MTEKRAIYFDHNATTPVHPLVLEAMLPYYKNVYGNASSIHQFGREARQAVEDARKKVAAFIGAQYDEIVFTSGGTEADNLAIKGAAFAGMKKGSHIITSSVEHHAVLNTCKDLEKQGFKVTYLPVDSSGIVDPEDLRKAITEETILITIMHANNETGIIQPIAECGRIAKEKKIPFHTDAVQSTGKLPVNVNDLNVDLLSLSAHKIYGPKGIGVLYIRKGTKIRPLFHGGHHEKNKRAGTENVPAIVGLGKAIELAGASLEKESARLTALCDRLYNGLTKNIEGVHINGSREKGLPNTLNVSFEFIEGEGIILNLDLEGIAASSGSACTSGSLDPSHVLKAMGVDPALSQGSVRFSLGMDNTNEDIDHVIQILPGIIEKLRAMSPLYKRR